MLGLPEVDADTDLYFNTAVVIGPKVSSASRDDVLVPWTSSKTLADGLPRAEFWMVPEGAHGFTVTEPGTFNAKVLSFLEEKISR